MHTLSTQNAAPERDWGVVSLHWYQVLEVKKKRCFELYNGTVVKLVLTPLWKSGDVCSIQNGPTNMTFN